MLALLHVKRSHTIRTVVVDCKMANIPIFFPVKKETARRWKEYCFTDTHFGRCSFSPYLLFASLKCINKNIVFSSWFLFVFFRLDLNCNLKFKYWLRCPRVSISVFLFIFTSSPSLLLGLVVLSVYLKRCILCSVFSGFNIKFLYSFFQCNLQQKNLFTQLLFLP